MKYKLLLPVLIACIFASCSTAYRATQTPDDVYYSPAHAVASKDDKNDDKNDRNVSRRDRYEDYESAEDRYLRMKVRDRYRWSAIDDYSYWYDTRYSCNNLSYSSYSKYNLSLNYGWNNCSCACYSNSYSSIFYPGYYNPFYSSYGYYPNVYIINNPKLAPNVNRPRLGGYRNNSYNNNNTIGNTLKKVFTPNTNGYSNRNTTSDNSYRSTERTYSPSSSSGSSSGSGSSSSSGAGRPSRPARN
jgi:hypothetical protein